MPVRISTNATMDDYYNFLKGFRTRHFSRGELILVQGEVPECAYAIKRGVVKTYNLTHGGEERPLGFDIEPEIFPLPWVYQQVSHVQYYYEAFIDTELYCVPAAAIRDFFATHQEAQGILVERLVAWQMHMQMRMNALEQSKASQKILNTIHFLCLRFGQEQSNDLVRIQLPLTQQDLANFIGLTRETTGIELKKLHQRGVLDYRKQNYLVHTDVLSELLDEEYGIGIVFEKAAMRLNTAAVKELIKD